MPSVIQERAFRAVDKQALASQYETLPFNIYEYNNRQQNYVLSLKKGANTGKITKTDKKLFIHTRDFQGDKSQLNSRIADKKKMLSIAISSELIDFNTKLNSLYEYGDALTEKNIYHPEDPDSINDSQEFLEGTSELLKKNPLMVRFLKAMNYSSDYYIRRSINTSIITMAFLDILRDNYKEISNSQIQEAALGTLLKDISMLELPKNILEKEGKLTDDELELVHSHPGRAFQRLSSAKLGLSDVSIDAVRYHHEYNDGSGYPYGLNLNKIPVFVKAVVICDIFSALTSPRNGRESLSSFEALKKINAEYPGKLDKDILKRFILFYGPGTVMQNNIS